MRRLKSVTALTVLMCLTGCATAAAHKPIDVFVEPRFNVTVV